MFCLICLCSCVEFVGVVIVICFDLKVFSVVVSWVVICCVVLGCVIVSIVILIGFFVVRLF